MSKRTKTVSSRSNFDWETAKSTGFAPQWKPQRKGDDVIFIPLKARIIPKGKNMDNEGVGVDCRLVGGASDSFWRRDVKAGVANGETFSIALSFALAGDDGLAVHSPDPKGKKTGTCRLSTLAAYCLSKSSPMRIVFDGQLKMGKRRMNVFNLQTQKGVLEAAFSQTPNKK